jgi:hypothetical protein
MAEGPPEDVKILKELLAAHAAHGDMDVFAPERLVLHGDEAAGEGDDATSSRLAAGLAPRAGRQKRGRRGPAPKLARRFGPWRPDPAALVPGAHDEWHPAIHYRTLLQDNKPCPGPHGPTPGLPVSQYCVPPFVVDRAGDVNSAPVEWLWPRRIPRGRLTLLAGDAGVGKSFVALDVAARVSSGAPWPDAPDVPQEPANVLVFSTEDDLRDTIRPRLAQSRADLNRVCVVEGILNEPTVRAFRPQRRFRVPEDLRTLKRAIIDLAPIKLIVLDPIMAYCGKGDGTAVSSVHAVLEPLAWLAALSGVSVLGTVHLRRGSRKAVHRAAGNPAFTTAARAVWGIVRDAEERRRRLMVPVKLNLAPDGDSLAFDIENDGRLVWNPTPVAVDSDEAMAEERGGKKQRAAAERLREFLAGGWRRASEVFAMAEREGFSEGTINRAADALGVESMRRGGKDGGFWIWTMDGTPGGQEAGGRSQEGREGGL